MGFFQANSGGEQGQGGRSPGVARELAKVAVIVRRLKSVLVEGVVAQLQHDDPSFVATSMFQLQAQLRPGRFQGKLLGPLQNHDSRLGENILQA
jgi:hypothetical protein